MLTLPDTLATFSGLHIIQPAEAPGSPLSFQREFHLPVSQASEIR
jgi:hypothetical protein